MKHVKITHAGQVQSVSGKDFLWISTDDGSREYFIMNHFEEGFDRTRRLMDVTNVESLEYIKDFEGADIHITAQTELGITGISEFRECDCSDDKAEGYEEVGSEDFHLNFNGADIRLEDGQLSIKISQGLVKGFSIEGQL